MQTNKSIWQSLILAFSLLTAGSLQAGQFMLDLSYQFETGDYGTDTSTDVTTIPLTLSYFADVWSFSAELTQVSVTGDETVIPGTTSRGFGRGAGSTSTLPSTTVSSTRSGMGDSRLSIARAFFPQYQDEWLYEITASVKLATADQTASLGTGEHDYSIKLALSSTLGNWMPGFTLGYQITGDTADTDYNDVLFVSAGAGYQLSKSSTLGIGYDFQQAVTNDADDFAAINLNFSHKLSDSTRLSMGIKSGLTDNSPDQGFNLSASFQF